MTKTKIVLDADVIIHFAKGNCLNVLPTICPKYDFVVLDIVYNEIKDPLKTQLIRQIHYVKNLSIIKFEPNNDHQREFARLLKLFGKGESACMVYCRYHKEVIGSSNLRDIKEYCRTHNITYLTTLDFLYYAKAMKILSTEEVSKFINEVRNKGSRLPNLDWASYKPTVNMDEL